MGFPDEDCVVGNPVGIWINFISRWKQCPPKDLSHDGLQNNCLLQGHGPVSKWSFYSYRVPHDQSLFKNHIQRKYIYQLKVAFEACKSLFVSLKDRIQFIALGNAGDSQVLTPLQSLCSPKMPHCRCPALRHSQSFPTSLLKDWRPALVTAGTQRHAWSRTLAPIWESVALSIDMFQMLWCEEWFKPRRQVGQVDETLPSGKGWVGPGEWKSWKGHRQQWQKKAVNVYKSRKNMVTQVEAGIPGHYWQIQANALSW